VPPDKTVVLGLVSTKTPVLESEDELSGRIDAAAQHVSIDRLCLSPQCGFSSVAGARQVVTVDDARRKLELLQRVAARAFP
jgi:5-methyltetrahydropteroyltriglutamate--homocysteine methyltransferase